ncbi:hypothetical protein VKT23_006263 [Stygiomarasmius scandens]|uniref:Uncharacterized protein n=1 Tax=Marasmiellus scandens TaxID=2682957 RepID=A0ABR1JPT2_9AGAR
MVWINELVRRIESGDYQGAAGTWAICTPDTILDPSRRRVLSQPMDTNHPAQEQSVLALDSEGKGVLECPLVWARESNKIACSYVWTYSSFDDVCNSTYYEGAVTFLELQIAKQGYRLAEWLNEIVG